MILQALKEYYDRKAADPEGEIAPIGLEKKSLEFLIVINQNGEFIEIEDQRERMGSKVIGRKYLLPRSIGRSGKNSYKTTFLLWDHIGYLLGQPQDDPKAKLQHQTWIKSLESLPEFIKSDSGIKAILLFYKKRQERSAIQSQALKECLGSKPCNMSFRLIDESLPIASKELILKYARGKSESNENDAKYGTCLVSGEYGKIARIHGKVFLTKDSNSFISFQKERGYDSYGKVQGYNAPITVSSEFSYVTALKILLKSEQKFLLGDTTYMFWSRESTTLENQFELLFSKSSNSNSNAGVEAVRSLLSSVQTGAYVSDDGDTKFYVLGLSPNSARIAVRFWYQGTVADIAPCISKHFEDFSIIKSKSEPEYYSLWRILVKTAVQDKSENINPVLAGEVMRSVLSGSCYPHSLLQSVIKRVKIKGEVSAVRAATLKACLNRKIRFQKNDKDKEISMALDPNYPSTGYQLGRLFAVLEKIQEEANPGLNATIRDRFYSSASSTPIVAFAYLMRLKNHHLSKLENRGRATNFEKRIGEIAEHFQSFPKHLDLSEQGCFAIGYYHQRQEFFKGRKE